jgi:hypothetical protein
MDVVETAVRAASAAGGQLLDGAIRAVDALRPAAKPLHPQGAVTRGVLHRLGSDTRSGAAWLDEHGTADVVVRWSRAVGLPSPAPDVFGLAVRVQLDRGRYGDLLFSTTGTGPLSRFVLVPSWSAERPMTTLLPYRTSAGPVLLEARPRSGRTVDLAWARGTGAWHHFATLRLDEDPQAAADDDVSFDPVVNPLPGLGVYGWVARLREPSYRRARRSRGEPAT